MPLASSAAVAHFLALHSQNSLSGFFGAGLSSEERRSSLRKTSADKAVQFMTVPGESTLSNRAHILFDHGNNPQIVGFTAQHTKLAVLNFASPISLDNGKEAIICSIGDSVQQVAPFIVPHYHPLGYVVTLMTKADADFAGFKYSTTPFGAALSDQNANPPTVAAELGFEIDATEPGTAVVLAAIPTVLPLPRGLPSLHLEDATDLNSILMKIMNVETEDELAASVPNQGQKLAMIWCKAAHVIISCNNGRSLIGASTSTLTPDIDIRDESKVNTNFIDTVIISESLDLPETGEFGLIGFNSDLNKPVYDIRSDGLKAKILIHQGLELTPAVGHGVVGAGTNAVPATNPANNIPEGQTLIGTDTMVKLIDHLTDSQGGGTASTGSKQDASARYAISFYQMLLGNVKQTTSDSGVVTHEFVPAVLSRVFTSQAGAKKGSALLRRDNLTRGLQVAGTNTPFTEHIRDYYIVAHADNPSGLIDENFATALMLGQFQQEVPRDPLAPSSHLSFASFAPTKSPAVRQEREKRARQQQQADQHRHLSVDPSHIPAPPTNVLVDHSFPDGLTSVKATGGNFQAFLNFILAGGAQDPENEPALLTANSFLWKVILDTSNSWAADKVAEHGSSFIQYLVQSFELILYQFVEFAKAATVQVEHEPNTPIDCARLVRIMDDAIHLATDWANAARIKRNPSNFNLADFTKRPAHFLPDNQRPRAAARTATRNSPADYDSSAPRQGNPSVWNANPSYQGVVKSRNGNGLIPKSVTSPDHIMIVQQNGNPPLCICARHIMAGRGCTADSCRRFHMERLGDLSPANQRMFNTWMRDNALQLVHPSSSERYDRNGNTNNRNTRFQQRSPPGQSRNNN